KVKTIRPFRAVNDGTAKLLQARDIRNCGPIELADSTYERVRGDDLHLAGRGTEFDRPASRVRIITGRGHLAVEFDMRTNPVFIRTATEIGEIGVPRRVIGWPIVIGPERELIPEVACCIDGATWIAVLEPGAADIIVFLKDVAGDAGLFQFDGGAN